MTQTPITVTYTLEEILGQIQKTLAKIQEDITELKIGQVRLENELKGEIKAGDLKLSGEIKALCAKVEGISKRLDTQEFINRSVVVGFVLAVGAAWLPLSAKQADYANALAKKYAGKNVVFYFVATDSANPKSKNFKSTDDIRKFASANKLNIPVLVDSDGALTMKKYDVDQMPSFVILNQNGKQVGESFGGIDPKYDVTIPISKAIDKIL